MPSATRVRMTEPRKCTSSMVASSDVSWLLRASRLTASGRSASVTGFSSPAVKRLARYFIGILNDLTSGISPSSPILPADAAEVIGDSGGTYHTIGNVRYSGCRGKATFHSIAIFQIGEVLAASSQA